MNSTSHPAMRAWRRAGFLQRFIADAQFPKTIVGFAGGAARHCSCAVVELEYRFHRVVIQAPWANVMIRLGAASRFFYPKNDRSRIGIMKLVSASISLAFFELSNLSFKVVHASQMRALALGGLKAVLLHDEHLSPQSYQLSVQFIGSGRDLCIIQRAYRRLIQADRLRYSGQQGHRVHESSPNVEKGGAGNPDSALHRNYGGGGRMTKAMHRTQLRLAAAEEPSHA